MKQWQEVKVSDVVEIIGGGTPKTTNSEFWDGDIPWLSIEDFNNDDRFVSKTVKAITEKGLENSSTKLLASGDLIISARGTVGKLAQLNKPMAFNQSCYGLKGKKEKVTNDFLYYALKTKIASLLNASHGAVFNTITRNTFDIISIPIPSQQEQVAISDILGALDQKIELNQRMNETLEEMARAIFKSWFVDFDPVYAKAAGREPEGMDERTAALFPSTFTTNGLPEGWEEKLLGALADILNGYAFKSEDYQENGLRLLRTKNFSEKGYAEVLSDDVFVPDEFWDEYNKYRCELFDFHLVMVGASVGKTSYALSNMMPCLRNQNMWCFRPKIKGTRFFVNLATEKKVSEVMGWASGSARTFFKKGDFQKHTVVYPGDELAKEFSSLVEPLYKRYDLNVKENKTLAALRDTLLPKLISGELRVNTTAEKPKEAV